MKTYVKPELMFEDFQMNMSFAVACAFPTRTHAGPDTCAVTPSGYESALFLTGNDLCVTEVTDYCYTPGNSYFGSV